MATVYVSYKSLDESFVKQVIARMRSKHEIFVDFNMPPGVKWRDYMLDKLKNSEVFVVFISSDTATSDYQNAEIGSAEFSSTFLDQKLIIPVMIDQTTPPRTIDHVDYLIGTHRDPQRTAKQFSMLLEDARQEFACLSAIPIRMKI